MHIHPRLSLSFLLCISRASCTAPQGARDRHRAQKSKNTGMKHARARVCVCVCGAFAKQVVSSVQAERSPSVRGPRSVFVANPARLGMENARACALIESFVQNRSQLLRPVIQSGTMSSRPDTSLSRNARGARRSRYARSYQETRSEMQIEVSPHNWCSLSTRLSENHTWTSEEARPQRRIGRGTTGSINLQTPDNRIAFTMCPTS